MNKLFFVMIVIYSSGVLGSEYLNGDKFNAFLESEIENIKAHEKNENKNKIKLSMLNRVKEAVSSDKVADDEFKFSVEEELYDVEIWEKFLGDAEQGITLYR